ncbi:hypothetical protein [Speluncibacter jeojiensis]|uniref:Uncharacterized protein n=1 Tax=Speluncibacter jeojiensis TaxID=2710754 RepID=A0A9X4M1J9_9ACTN|nr:hypothetical protein [Corynebacteriales bacterium D3-21]
MTSVTNIFSLFDTLPAVLKDTLFAVGGGSMTGGGISSAPGEIA